MKATVVEGTSTHPRLVEADVPRPRARPGEVVIEVASAGVNRADLLQVMGRYPSPPGWPEWPGLEVAGTITEVGPGVTDRSEGDAVCALVGGGGYAEAIAVSADLVVPTPDGVGMVAAGGLMEAACTVWSNLKEHVHHGGTLLVHGGSGGVGSLAVQIGRELGMRVITTARGPERAARCREELGAELAIDYTAEDFAPIVAAEGGADVVLDVVGGAYLAQNVAALAMHGTLVVIGRQGGPTGELDLGALMSKWATVTGTTLRNRPHHERAQIVADVESDIWPLVTRGARPIIHAALPLSNAAEAHRMLKAGEVFGKVVLTP